MAIIKPIDESKIFIQQLVNFAPKEQNIRVDMLRMDTVHPIISGNKWYKLKYSIADALATGYTSILSFGGAYSNHLIATAATAANAGMASVGIVRGEEIDNDVLMQCKAYGMALHFISRTAYAQKEDPDFLNKIRIQFSNSYIIPEGGANALGAKGAGEIARFIGKDYSHILLSVGTATTFIGLRNALPKKQILFGFAPMKGGEYLNAKIAIAVNPEQNINWRLIDRFHTGGFGKINDELRTFMAAFEMDYEFLLDRVYTAKMMLGLQELLQENAFPKQANILCIHTGGLTGN